MAIEVSFSLIRPQNLLSLSVFYMPSSKHQHRCHVNFNSLTVLLFSSPASRSARDPEEESSQLLSNRRRGSFYHRKELPERNQSYFSGECCRCCSQLCVVGVKTWVSTCKHLLDGRIKKNVFFVDDNSWQAEAKIDMDLFHQVNASGWYAYSLVSPEIKLVLVSDVPLLTILFMRFY